MLGTTPFKDDYPVILKAEEITNIHLKGTLPQSASDANSAFNAMISSGKLADIIHKPGRREFYKYGMEGAFTPLNDLIDNYAPNIKKFLEERPDVKTFMTAGDGNMYFIPHIPDGVAAKGWFIRQDWLDKLNLSAPKNIDGMYNVMKAFKESDPNGNGVPDEVPYFNKEATASYETAIDDLYIFWNTTKNFKANNGKVVFGPLEESFKEGTKTIAKWYKEELIDSEIYTRGGNARDMMLGNNIGGITHDWFASTSDFNNKLEAKIEGFKFYPFAPPAGYDGKIRESTRRDSISDEGWAISSSNQHPVETIKYFDFWFSGEGRRLMNFGIEGEDYTIVDGKPLFNDSILHGDKAANTLLGERGAQLRIGVYQDFEYERQWTNPIALIGIEEYTAGNYFAEQFPNLNFTEEEQTENDKIMKDIYTMRDEMIQQWILGVKDVDATYDAFAANVKRLGIDRATEIQQAAYDRSKILIPNQ
jgi:putative aldouronate transport system substrate-binding protein